MIDLYSEDIDKSYHLGRKLALMIGTFMGTVSMFMYVSWNDTDYREIMCMVLEIKLCVHK